MHGVRLSGLSCCSCRGFAPGRRVRRATACGALVVTGLAEPRKPDALDDWVRATAPRAIAYATSLLRDRTRAEDVVQDCYCRLLQKAAVYDLPRDGLKLLFKSITNACINLKTRERIVLSLDRVGAPDGSAGWGAEDRTAENPARKAMNRELEQAIANGLAQLPVLYRAALELKSLGHSLQEIAELLDVTATHAGVLIHRARQRMAEYLAPYVEETT